ncbi:MAG: hypothetical protein Q9182_000995 [Xanthomendoza sp. 2 TL-2023]
MADFQGNKILRQRLKGPSIAAYYPRRVVTFRDLQNLYPDLETWDEDEEDRLEHISILKSRGKGAPKKRGKDQTKRIMGKRKKKPVAPKPS